MAMTKNKILSLIYFSNFVKYEIKINWINNKNIFYI